MNNNNVIDRFENDVYADYPYRQDRDGYNLYGGVHLNEHIKLTVGRAAMDEISSKRKAQMDYAIATGTWEWPGVSARVFQYVRSVEDDIADDVIQWVDPDGFTEVVDPLITQDTFVYTGYLTFDYLRLKNLNIYNKVKYDFFKQRGEEADTKNDRLFLGMINKVDYPVPITDNLSLWPRWKSIYRKINPTFSTELDITEWSQFYMLTSKCFILPTTFLEYGVEWNLFRNLEKTTRNIAPRLHRRFYGNCFGPTIIEPVCLFGVFSYDEHRFPLGEACLRRGNRDELAYIHPRICRFTAIVSTFNLHCFFSLSVRFPLGEGRTFVIVYPRITRIFL